MHVLEAAAHLFFRDRQSGNRLRCVIVVGDDEVEHFPARKRVMHDVAFRPGPKRRGVPAQIFGHLICWNNGAIGCVAGDARAAVSDKLLADVRPQAVGTDEKRTFDRLARSKERAVTDAPSFS
jgi:hypothetical protein